MDDSCACVEFQDLELIVEEAVYRHVGGVSVKVVPYKQLKMHVILNGM